MWKKREGWGLGSADKALIGSLIHLHSLRWSRGGGQGRLEPGGLGARYRSVQTAGCSSGRCFSISPEAWRDLAPAKQSNLGFFLKGGAS